MPRTTNAPASRERRRKVLKKAKGFRGARKKQLKSAYAAVDHAKAHAYVGRKQKKRQYRRLWNVRINAACRQAGTTYSRFMSGLRQNGVSINRKMLADLAVNDPEAFQKLVEKAKAGAGQ